MKNWKNNYIKNTPDTEGNKKLETEKKLGGQPVA